MVIRRHLNVQNTQVFTPGTDLRKVIMDEVLKSDSILSRWKGIAQCIPAKYKPYSIELL